MNRIILIGNGFDLAHGMRTSYHDFLNNYWENTIKEIQETELDSLFENAEIKIDRCPNKFLRGSTYSDLEKSVKQHQTKLRFKNEFLRIITNQSNIEHWVDVENEYYLLLKKILRKEIGYNIRNLNSDFNAIKKRLGTYLQEVEEKFTDKLSKVSLKEKGIIGRKIYKRFELKDFSESSINKIAEEEHKLLSKYVEMFKRASINGGGIIDNEKEKIIDKIGKDLSLVALKKLMQSEIAYFYFDLIPDQTLILNFNYTATDFLYNNPKFFSDDITEKQTSMKSIHIHGTTDEYDNNEMIFGFGDELDEDYKLIERLNDNSYLENIKSINYLEASNYKRLLDFIDSDVFQVFIFGHSCGTSDRTMLNTIFEHDNCASIKPFYHQKCENNDNYSDIVRNISRNFNDKAKMRDRVVNKSYCEPLS
tara:strand:- start:9010 stop:10272 length:1263 start_codon:yes stop_codon:yes gene_type:complete